MCAYSPRHARPRPHRIIAALGIAAGVAAVLAAVLVPSLARLPAPLSTPRPSASTPAPAHAAPRPPATQRPSPARTAPVSRYTVRPGDSLWAVSLERYGTGYAWGRIWAANRGALDNHPGVITPGQVLTIPPGSR